MANLDAANDGGFWKVADASRARVVVDAADYFALIEQAMLCAEQRIMLIGWDFDTRISLSRSGDLPQGAPRRLGDFIIWLAKRRPGLEIRILKWNFGALKLLGRGAAILDVIRWAWHKRITFKLDSAHPLGCSHHQKIIIIDDQFAACGGIDMTSDRWDTRAHLDDDPMRKRPNGEPYRPWHDVTMIIEGDAAAALAELGRDRWVVAGGKPMRPCTPVKKSAWPDDVDAHFTNTEIGIARSRAAYRETPAVREIETLFIEQIRRAKKFIYAENQYFASRKLAEAIALRMAEDNPPEIIIVGPEEANGWLEQKAMDSARVRLVRAIGEKDHKSRFSIFIPYTAAGHPIYVHAKLLIVDDELIRVGSANMNNRSLGLDSECDVVIDGAVDATVRATIRSIRHDLLAEHCDLPVPEMTRRLELYGSMRSAIESAQAAGSRRLTRLELPELTDVEKALADNAILDPERPEELFEPLSSPGLFSRSRILRAPN